MSCECTCHPGPYKDEPGGYTKDIGRGSRNSVLGCCWWEHVTDEQTKDNAFLLWKCYKFMKEISLHEWNTEHTEKFYTNLYRWVADRVHDDDFPEVKVW